MFIVWVKPGYYIKGPYDEDDYEVQISDKEWAEYQELVEAIGRKHNLFSKRWGRSRAQYFMKHGKYKEQLSDI